MAFWNIILGYNGVRPAGAAGGFLQFVEMRMSKESTSTAVTRSSVFGPPLVLEGEDAAAYDELLARVRAAVKPIDVIDEMLVNDVVCLQWETLRWRRVKLSSDQSEPEYAAAVLLVRGARLPPLPATL